MLSVNLMLFSLQWIWNTKNKYKIEKWGFWDRHAVLVNFKNNENTPNCLMDAC